MKITEDDVTFESTRSGGPGGQHANRRSTAVRLRARIDELPLTDEEKQFVHEYLPPKNRTKQGELLVENAEFRSQRQNRRRALEIANQEIEEAIENGRQAREKQRRKKRVEQSRGGGGGGSSREDVRDKRRRRYRSESTEDLLEEALEEDPDTMKKYFESDSSPEDD